MKCILYVVVLISVTVGAHNNQCCGTGQRLIGINHEPFCRDPVSNSTLNITLTCPERYPEKLNYTIDDEGSLHFYIIEDITDEETEITLPLGRYCIGSKVIDNHVQLEETIVVYCVDESNSLITNDIHTYCMIVSAIFLALTALVYSLLPELRDLLGKSIINYCLSAFIAFVLLIIMGTVQFSTATTSDIALCALRGFLAYFFNIASFIWTNAISIQILISMRRPYLYDRGWREFLRYALYAWGSSAAITMCVVIANYVPGDHKRPGIGLMHCWFYKNHEWYYLYSVLGIVCVANIVIFSWCLYQLWSQRFDSSHIRAVRYKCTLSLRLFVLMGLPWVCELISQLIESNILVAILDLVTILQGVLIFVVLVLLRQRALKAMLKRGWLCCLSPSIEKHLALVEDVEDIAEHTVDYRLDDQTQNEGPNGVTS